MCHFDFLLSTTVNKFEFEIIEVLAAEIDLGNKKVKIVTIYKHPKANVPMSFRDLHRLFDLIGNNNMW